MGKKGGNCYLMGPGISSSTRSFLKTRMEGRRNFKEHFEATLSLFQRKKKVHWERRNSVLGRVKPPQKSKTTQPPGHTPGTPTDGGPEKSTPGAPRADMQEKYYNGKGGQTAQTPDPPQLLSSFPRGKDLLNPEEEGENICRNRSSFGGKKFIESSSLRNWDSFKMGGVTGHYFSFLIEGGGAFSDLVGKNHPARKGEEIHRSKRKHFRSFLLSSYVWGRP